MLLPFRSANVTALDRAVSYETYGNARVRVLGESRDHSGKIEGRATRDDETGANG
jgi:hypothetical protein